VACRGKAAGTLSATIKWPPRHKRFWQVLGSLNHCDQTQAESAVWSCLCKLHSDMVYLLSSCPHTSR
jgi:hypothetical protein